MDFALQLFGGGDFRGSEIASGEVEGGETEAVFAGGDGDEEIAFARGEEIVVQDGSRRDYLEDFALDQSLASLGSSVCSAMATFSPFARIFAT